MSRLSWSVVVCLSLSGIASAQTGGALDVRACFSNILVDVTIDKSNKNIRYALQQQWSESLYDEARKSNTLTAWIGGATAQDSYETSNIKRVEEMYKMSEDYSYSANSSLYRASLNPQAKAIIFKCLDALAAQQGLGLYWVPWVHYDNPTLIDLELRFQYQPPTTKLYIVTKRIDNATVEDDHGSHPTKLFRPNNNAITASTAKFVTLKRAKPSDAVTIQIETTPNLSVRPITIDAEPNPSSCQLAYQPESATINDLHIDQDNYLMKDQNGNPIREGNGSAFKIAIPLQSQYPDGTDFTGANITNIICERQGLPEDFFDWSNVSQCCLKRVNGFTEKGLTAVCRGWWQNRGRRIKMMIEWQKLGVQCPSHDWAYTNGKWQ